MKSSNHNANDDDPKNISFFALIGSSKIPPLLFFTSATLTESHEDGSSKLKETSITTNNSRKNTGFSTLKRISTIFRKQLFPNNNNKSSFFSKVIPLKQIVLSCVYRDRYKPLLEIRSDENTYNQFSDLTFNEQGDIFFLAVGSDDVSIFKIEILGLSSPIVTKYPIANLNGPKFSSLNSPLMYSPEENGTFYFKYLSLYKGNSELKIYLFKVSLSNGTASTVWTFSDYWNIHFPIVFSHVRRSFIYATNCTIKELGLPNYELKTIYTEPDYANQFCSLVLSEDHTHLYILVHRLIGHMLTYHIQILDLKTHQVSNSQFNLEKPESKIINNCISVTGWISVCRYRDMLISLPSMELGCDSYNTMGVLNLRDGRFTQIKRTKASSSGCLLNPKPCCTSYLRNPDPYHICHWEHLAHLSISPYDPNFRWKPTLHYKFSEAAKKRVMAVLILASWKKNIAENEDDDFGFQTCGKTPRYPQCSLHQLPKEILFFILEWAIHIQDDSLNLKMIYKTM